MNGTRQGNPVASPGRESAWGHVLVAVSACVLTVSIVGSVVYLSFRAYERYQYRERVRVFVSALGNRSDAELDEIADQLKSKKKLAKYVLPELLDVVRESGSERRQVAAIRVSRGLINKNRVRDALFSLRNDPRESVAASAVGGLAAIRPPEKAAELLGQCLAVVSGSVVDEACAGLVRQGEAGRVEYVRRAGMLSVDRRVWLVGYVRVHGGDDIEAWMTLFREDAEAKVREAAAAPVGNPRGEPPDTAGS